MILMGQRPRGRRDFSCHLCAMRPWLRGISRRPYITPPSDPRKDHGCGWRRKSTRIAGSWAFPASARRHNALWTKPRLSRVGVTHRLPLRRGPGGTTCDLEHGCGAVGSRPTSGAGARRLHGLRGSGGRDLDVPGSWSVGCLSATLVTPGVPWYSLGLAK
ncbi:unnamed protein product [Rangifer tarandus platyrhynchus]|uniref:Uncharacterized protein n=1 Tax=Rangifer tarandus platyrhynchus TaxID=3082113 RepID=A0ABN8ZU09_RANTA|nr:unnamed protein product [Rangifer tarandus platyrhynchus]